MDQLLMVTSRQEPCQDPEPNLRVLGRPGGRELKCLHPDCPELPWLGLPSAPGSLGRQCVHLFPRVNKRGMALKAPS